jgi:UDP-glucose 4-epimerase
LPVSHAPVVPCFLNAVLTGGSIVIFGNGEQSRDFVYVDDVVHALISAASAKDVNRKVINIGSGIETKVADLALMIEKITGGRTERVWNREKTGGVSRLVADISMAREYLGFQPSSSFEEALRLTLDIDPRFG